MDPWPLGGFYNFVIFIWSTLTCNITKRLSYGMMSCVTLPHATCLMYCRTLVGIIMLICYIIYTLLLFRVRQDCSHFESKRLFQANKVPNKTRPTAMQSKHDPTFRQTFRKHRFLLSLQGFAIFRFSS